MSGKKQINIAIDGPVASGKGTVAKILSEKLNIPTLNTGALYRGVTFWLLENGINCEDEKEVLLAIPKIDMRVFVVREDETTVFINGKDVTSKLFENRISVKGAVVAAYPEVRDYVNTKIHEIAKQGSFIVEGRDIGIKVLPDAQYKFFLTASVEVRAKRRYDDLKRRGENVKMVDVLIQIKERDEMDINRKTDPLRMADDAILIDSTNMNAQQVIDKILSYIKLN
jgi:cytidylate kinase